ncbi:unnamed protein product [Coregonus sp. 'balchen']|nr:unnamed protein product [Coregonus sp. 'balchen']
MPFGADVEVQEEATARVLQLEDDLMGVTQKGLQKETELDSLKDRVKKLTLEKDGMESHLKDEKDEKELYKDMVCSGPLPPGSRLPFLGSFVVVVTGGYSSGTRSEGCHWNTRQKHSYTF